MIQRIQSLYLLVAIVLLAAMTVFNDVWGGDVAEQVTWFPTLILVLIALAAGMSFVALLMYKSRQRQYALIGWAEAFTVLLLGVLVVGLLITNLLVPMVSGGNLRVLFALVLPLIAFIMLVLARRGVKSDIALVRSMDRLR